MITFGLTGETVGSQAAFQYYQGKSVESKISPMVRATFGPN